jgi:hypothetical protein
MPETPEPESPGQPWELFVQPDQRSCGATAMVVARILGDPAYAQYVEGTGGLQNARTVAGARALEERFRTEALAMHARITGLSDVSGRPQIPWPRKYGTPPWAVARQLSATRAADGTTTPYSWHLARTELAQAYSRLLDASRAGRVSAIFIGSTWIPRHVVLVVDATPRGTLHVYDPARGRLPELDRFAFLGNRIDIAGWDVAWMVVTPDS